MGVHDIILGILAYLNTIPNKNWTIQPISKYESIEIQHPERRCHLIRVSKTEVKITCYIHDNIYCYQEMNAPKYELEDPDLLPNIARILQDPTAFRKLNFIRCPERSGGGPPQIPEWL